MSVRTVLGFYRAYWLSLSLCLGIMALYLTSALVHGDYWYALAGMLVLTAGLGWLWRRYDPPS
ncbi:LPXTG cell wall anchor domain-containing protein [Halalkalicoccus tibetensis]|uniref:LPXTG cell wall anchor domain-containing protein n=1 Tax=Halalkalicoccus tibetensis TaxID=175632 RepID=A0ABD5V2Y1_9EURY